MSPFHLFYEEFGLTGIDRTCSTNTRDEGTWGQGGDCEYGPMIAHEAGWTVDISQNWEMGRTCCMLYDFWVPSVRYNHVALCIIQLDLSNRPSPALF